MPEHAGSAERRNIRPYIIGLCFACGLVFGFVFYVVTPTAAKIHAARDAQIREEEAIQRNARQQQGESIQQAPKMAVIDERLKNDLTIPEVKPVDDKAFGPEQRIRVDMRKIPDPQAMTLNYDSGLNGKTTYRPVEPVKVIRPVSATPARTAPAAVVRAVPINDVAPPELDD